MRNTIRQSIAQAQPWTGRFDSGDYSALAYDADTIRITPRKHWNNNWAWWCAKSNQLGGKTPTFAIDKASHYNLDAGERLCCWATAADTDTWNDFDNVAIGANDITFSNNTPFPNGMIYIAALPMYPFSRVQRMVKKWADNAKVVQTSSTAGFVLGTATWRGNGDGRAAGALPFYGLKVTSANANSRGNMIFAAYDHPSETPGPYALEGFMDWLLAQGAIAKFLLDWFDIYVYPCLNPQGVNGGWFRSGPQVPATDHNRLWATSGTAEDIDAYNTAMAADTGTEIEAGIGFHSYMQNSNDCFGSVEENTSTNIVAFRTEMLALDASFSLLVTSISESLKYRWINTYGATVSVSVENGGSTLRTTSTFKTSGQNAGIALARMLSKGYFTHGPGVGSRDFNGSTDRIDWSNAYAPYAAPITVSAWIYSDGVTGAAEYLCEIHSSGDAANGLNFYLISSASIGFSKRGSTILYRGVSTVNLAGAWHHVLVTHDGTDTDYTKIHIYIDGTEGTELSSPTNGVDVISPSGSYSIGGRIYDDTRNFDGKIAQVGVWDRVLNATEIANLAAGYAPDLVDGGSNLKFYFKGNTSSLVAVVGGTGTADGTTSVTGVGNGPAIIYA